MENTSGIQPAWFNVLVKPDPVANKNERGENVSDGGIIITEETADLERVKQQKATIVALGHRAFEDGNSEFSDGEKRVIPLPVKPGQRVLIQEFSGFTFTGEDGENYVTVTDKQILSFLTGESDES